MITFLDKLNEKFENKYKDFRLEEVVYVEKEKTIYIAFLYPDFFEISKEDEKEINSFLKSSLNADDVKVKVNFKRDFIDDTILRRIFLNYINSFASLKNIIDIEGVTISQEKEKFIIRFKTFCEFENLTHIIQNIENDFREKHCYQISLEHCGITENNKIVEDVKDLESIDALKEKYIPHKVEITYNVEDLELVFGQSFSVENAIPANKLKKEVGVEAVVFGEIDNMVQLPVYKRGENIDTNNEENIIRYKNRISLKEANISISTSIAIPKENKDILNCLNAGDKVIASVTVKEFNNITYIQMNAIARCNYYVTSGDLDKELPYPPRYLFCEPYDYQESEQLNLFTMQNEVHPQLKGKTFVVFDLETTGLDTATARLVEIGAVKIENGRITQLFQTFVNPEMHIPEDASKVNNIFDDMVKDAPKFNEVILDFLRFVDGAPLIGHNVSYDISVLNSNSRKFGFQFNNELIDTLALSREKLPMLHSHRLNKVCDYVGVSLEGAHRAVNDALATAKVYLKLVKNY